MVSVPNQVRLIIEVNMIMLFYHIGVSESWHSQSRLGHYVLLLLTLLSTGVFKEQDCCLEDKSLCG